MNGNGFNIPLTVYIGIGVMLLLIISFLIAVVLSQKRKWKFQHDVQQLREQQQNHLIQAAVRSEESERHRIAEQLHDEVGAILSSTRLHFSNINSAQLDQRGKDLHEKSKELLDESIQKVRSISHNLHSTLLKEFGLNEAIRHFMTKTIQGSLLKVEIELDPNYIIKNPQTDLGVYRILQELVNNILKHAKATYIGVSSAIANEMLSLKITHDGTGLNQQEFETLRYKPEGLGLKNIQNRIILLGGSIFFEKNEAENKILLTIPTTDAS